MKPKFLLILSVLCLFLMASCASWMTPTRTPEERRSELLTRRQQLREQMRHERNDRRREELERRRNKNEGTAF